MFCLNLFLIVVTICVLFDDVESNVVSERSDGFRHPRSVTRKLSNKASFSGKLRTDNFEDLPQYFAHPIYSENDIDSLKTTFLDESSGDQYEQSFIEISDVLPSLENDVVGEFSMEDEEGNDDDEQGDENNDEEGGNNRRRTVILGSDTRVEKRGIPTSGPSRYTVCIDIGSSSCACTGYVIDYRWILTAGHCLYDTDNNAWIGSSSNYCIWPRRTRDYQTSTCVRGVRRVVWSSYISTGSWAYDQGWIELASSAGVGYGSFGWSSSLSSGYFFSHFGYPSDKSDGSMWQTSGFLSSASTYYLLTSTTDTYFGNSGGPWYRTSNNVVYASHVGGSTSGGYNYHCRITQSRFNAICNYLQYAC